MKIGNIQFTNNLILAPMAGITDVAFRSMCVGFGADCGVTELISAKALCYGNQKTIDMLATAPNERIKIVQLFGDDPEYMARACALPALEKFDIIDINMGCPAPKIARNGEGASLMLDMDKARSIIEACVKATNKPVTVKFRKGWDDDNVNCVQFAVMCEKAGASAITVHGRTRQQFYSGKADWQAIADVKRAVSIPVIANGDVVDVDSYNAILATTKCDAVMIGRGALGNPQIFSEILGRKADVNAYDLATQHINILRKFYPERFLIGHMRKHFLWYVKGLNGANKVKVLLATSNDIDASLRAIKQLCDQAHTI